MGNKRTNIPFSRDRLKRIMDENGIKPEEICKFVGDTYSNYKQWRRRGNINPMSLEKIAYHLNVDVDWLKGEGSDDIVPQYRGMIRIIRCYECIHNRTDNCAMRYQYICNRKVYLASPMDFCSFAERKEE